MFCIVTVVREEKKLKIAAVEEFCALDLGSCVTRVLSPKLISFPQLWNQRVAEIATRHLS
jgi:hypothetical protein